MGAWFCSTSTIEQWNLRKVCRTLDKHSIWRVFSFSWFRYIYDGFLTTNLTREEIHATLKEADSKDPNIWIAYTIASVVDFLDVTISNEDGQLTTSIFHKPAAEPYVLPFTSDHPRHVHRNIPYAALLRAARICSNVHDFGLESVRIDMALLSNEYPPVFISKYFNRFFELNNAVPVLKRLDAQVYHDLHQKRLHQPTRREKELQTWTLI